MARSAGGKAAVRLVTRFAWPPPVALAAAIIALRFVDWRESYESARLLFALNVICTTTISAFIAVLAGRSFLSSGQPSLLMLCCAMIVWGASAFIAVMGSRVGNYNITIHNLGVLASAMCHLAGVAFMLRSTRPMRASGGALALACSGALLAVGLIWLSAMEEWLPVFFVNGAGGTPIREAVLLVSVASIGTAAALMWSRRRQVESNFLRLYSLGLALVAVGAIGLIVMKVHGSVLGWTARAAQYLGSLYMLAAAVIAVRESRRWELPLTVALEQIKDDYELLFQSINDGIVLHKVTRRGAGTEFVRANDVLCRMLGCGAAEAARLIPADLVGAGAAVREAALPRADGRVVLAEVSSRAFEHRGQRMALTVIRDVTERRRAEEALREADRRKDEFLATLAHELRNPLAPIRNGLGVIKLAKDDPGAVEQARRMMERQLVQMVHLVDDLLDVSRISRGKLELRRERIDVEEVIQNALETCGPLIEQSGHNLAVTRPGRPVWIEGDVTRLAQALCNVLSNAAKYTEKNGRIALSVERQGSDVVLSVKDSGIGIPPEMLPRVFDMFVQVDHASPRAQGGLGIGLSLVQRLVEMHGGSVEAKSAGPGAGSEFIIRLPALLTSAPEGEPRQEAPGGERRAPGRRIVIADDNADSAHSLATLLTIWGNEVRTADDGAQALEVAEAFRPTVIVLDIGMPKLNGYEACRRIRERDWGKDATLIALTGWGQDDDKRRSKEAGFDHHLTKPVDHGALERLLAAAVPVAAG